MPEKQPANEMCHCIIVFNIIKEVLLILFFFNKESFSHTSSILFYYIFAAHFTMTISNKMRRIIPIIILLVGFTAYSCTSIKGNQEKESTGIALKSSTANSTAPEQLTYNGFLKKVWNFEKHPKGWVYEGDVPSVIDFYADWCGPCKLLAPIMVQMAKKYNGKVKFYRVNVDKEKKLASAFRIRSIPAVLFIPEKGKPLMQVGLLPHNTYVQIINKQLLHIKQQTKVQ